MRWYAEVHAAVQRVLPTLRATQAANLALLVGALLARRTLNLTALARGYPGPAVRRGRPAEARPAAPRQAAVALPGQRAARRAGPAGRLHPAHRRGAAAPAPAGAGDRLDDVRRAAAGWHAAALPGAARRGAALRAGAAARAGRRRPRRPARRPGPAPAGGGRRCWRCCAPCRPACGRWCWPTGASPAPPASPGSSATARRSWSASPGAPA